MIDGWGVFMISLFLILVVFQIIFLVRYSESSFKKVRLFLDNIKQDKYSQLYPVKFDGTETDDLHIEFNAILAKLKEDQAEKEANYQYFRSVFKHLSIGLITFRENGEIQILNVAAKRILNIDELKNIAEIESQTNTSASVRAKKQGSAFITAWLALAPSTRDSITLTVAAPVDE